MSPREKARINSSIVCELNAVAVSDRQYRLLIPSAHICRFNSDLIYTPFHVDEAVECEKFNRFADLLQHKSTLYSPC